MKVYVDKNDLDFIEDSFLADNTKLISEFYHEESELEYDDCELLDLTDYTKQVRKELKEEIAKNVHVVCINGVMYASYSDLEKILYDEKQLPKWETLNKEGE